MIDPYTWSMNRESISDLYDLAVQDTTQQNVTAYFTASESWCKLLNRAVRDLKAKEPCLETSCNLTDVREDLREIECMDRAVKHLKVKE